MDETANLLATSEDDDQEEYEPRTEEESDEEEDEGEDGDGVEEEELDHQTFLEQLLDVHGRADDEDMQGE